MDRLIKKGSAFLKEKSQDQAHEQAIRFLGIRARSRMEVERFLSQKGYAGAVIASVLNQLIGSGYISDTAFSKEWVASRLRRKPKSTMAIAWELRQKGVSEKDIEEAVSQIDEAAAAWSAVQHKLRLWRSLESGVLKQKMIPFLKRRGFSNEVCRETVSRALAACKP